MPPPSPTAAYQVISQIPIAPESPALRQEDGDEDGDEASELISSSSKDSRTIWVLFVIGCAILLPWNGKDASSVVYFVGLPPFL
jgi:hypothetical protein